MAELTYERRGPRETSGTDEASGAHEDPGARTLVLLHGIGSRWQMWEPVMDRLSAAHDVIALDLPGFGSSPLAPAGTPPGLEGLADGVSQFLSGLEVTRPHVVGNSLGGLVALELAQRGQARSVTALSPAGFANRAESLQSLASLRVSHRLARLITPAVAGLAEYAWFRRLAFRQMTSRAGNLTPTEVAESIRALAGAPAFPETLRAIRGHRFSLLGALDVPVTIAWGERDRLLPRRQAARAVAQIPGARLVWLPGCGHIPTYDDPELVARVILEGILKS